MRKKLLVMFMTVCMIVSLVACGNSENSDKNTSTSETVVENEANDKTVVLCQDLVQIKMRGSAS